MAQLPRDHISPQPGVAGSRGDQATGAVSGSGWGGKVIVRFLPIDLSLHVQYLSTVATSSPSACHIKSPASGTPCTDTTWSYSFGHPGTQSLILTTSQGGLWREPGFGCALLVRLFLHSLPEATQPVKPKKFPCHLAESLLLITLIFALGTDSLSQGHRCDILSSSCWKRVTRQSIALYKCFIQQEMPHSHVVAPYLPVTK